jgi:alpha-galactosidase
VDGWHPHDRTKTNAQILMDLYSLIEEAANGAVVIGCNTYNHLAAGIHEIQRSGCDTSGWNWSTTKENGINCLVYRLCQNNTFFETDADCACFTSHVPTDKNILFADLISRCNSALFVSAAPDILKTNDIDQLIEIFRRSAVTKTEAEPLDWLVRETPEEFLYDGNVYKYNWD